jgi:putative flippase GtrA
MRGASISRRTLVQFVKFNLVGALNTILATTVYVVVAYASDSYTLGLVADYGFGIAFGFVLNKQWTFAHRDAIRASAVVRYVVLYGAVFALNYALLRVAVETCGYDRYLAQVAIFAVIVVPIFLVQKRYVFADKEARP